MNNSKHSRPYIGKALGFGLVLFLGLFSRFYWIPGRSFSSQYWDDEKLWVQQMESRNLIEQVFLRDTPGYFIPLPRFLLWITSVTGMDPAISLRISIYFIQTFCLLFAIKVFTGFRLRKISTAVLILALNTIYIEELNYLHFIGYLLYFPARYLLGLMISSKQKLLPFLYLAFALLLSKPIVAILLLLSIFVLARRNFAQFFLRLIPAASIAIIYLVSYFLLPHGWETPFNTEPRTGISLLINILWIFPAILLPAVYVGFFGWLHLHQFEFIASLMGIVTSISFFAGIVKFYKVFPRAFRYFTENDKELLVLVLFSYLLGYSAVNSILITQFPLWTNVQPQWIWNRYTALLPYLVILLLHRLLLRFKSGWEIKFSLLILGQNVLLQLLAVNVLRRFW